MWKTTSFRWKFEWNYRDHSEENQKDWSAKVEEGSHRFIGFAGWQWIELVESALKLEQVLISAADVKSCTIAAEIAR